jgi:hypothetical protein
VKILQAADGKGKLEISFLNTQDLDRIYNLLVPTCANLIDTIHGGVQHV